MMMLGKKHGNRDIAQVIVEHMSKPEGSEHDETPQAVENPERDASPGLQAAGEKLMTAFHAKDTRSLVGAIKDMFDMLSFEESGE